MKQSDIAWDGRGGDAQVHTTTVSITAAGVTAVDDREPGATGGGRAEV